MPVAAITAGVAGYGAYKAHKAASNANKDEPFAYDNAASAFIAITGVTNANSPTKTTRISMPSVVIPASRFIGKRFSLLFIAPFSAQKRARKRPHTTP